MKAKLFYRIAAVLFVLFAAGHTFGFLKFKPPTPEGIAVRDSMKNVHFRVEGRDYSYGGFYDGFGWYISAYLLFSAFLAWQLGRMASAGANVVGAIGWAFFAVQVIGLALSCIYFIPIPAIFSGIVALCLGLAAWFT